MALAIMVGLLPAMANARIYLETTGKTKEVSTEVSAYGHWDEYVVRKDNSPGARYFPSHHCDAFVGEMQLQDLTNPKNCLDTVYRINNGWDPNVFSVDQTVWMPSLKRNVPDELRRRFAVRARNVEPSVADIFSNEQIADLRSALGLEDIAGEVAEGVATIEATVEEAKAKLAGFTDLDAKFSAFSDEQARRWDELEDENDRLQHGINTVGGQIGDVATRVSSHDVSIERLTAEQASLKAHVARLVAHLDLTPVDMAAVNPPIEIEGLSGPTFGASPVTE